MSLEYPLEEFKGLVKWRGPFCSAEMRRSSFAGTSTGKTHFTSWTRFTASECNMSGYKGSQSHNFQSCWCICREAQLCFQLECCPSAVFPNRYWPRCESEIWGLIQLKFLPKQTLLNIWVSNTWEISKYLCAPITRDDYVFNDSCVGCREASRFMWKKWLCL